VEKRKIITIHVTFGENCCMQVLGLLRCPVSLSVLSVLPGYKNKNSVTIEMYKSDGVGSSLCALDSGIIAL